MTLDALVISRDREVADILRPILDKMGVTVEVCAAATAAGEILVARKFDAIIVDCDDLSGGIEVMQALRKTRSNKSTVVFALLNGNHTTECHPLFQCRPYVHDSGKTALFPAPGRNAGQSAFRK